MSRATCAARALLLLPLFADVAMAQLIPFHYPLPPLERVRVTRGVRYATVDTTALAMDVYRPKQSTTPAPALIVYSLYWPESHDTPARESNDQAKSWARIAAARGIVTIIPDLRAEPGTGNAQAPARARSGELDRLLVHLAEHADDYGIDRRRVVLFAASGNVASALPAVEDPRQTGITAAVFYYGGAGANVATFRRDVPVLFVRAGLDSPGMNAAIDALAARALTQNAPLTLVNHHTGHHAFEAMDDDAATRRIIDQTIDYVAGVAKQSR